MATMRQLAMLVAVLAVGCGGKVDEDEAYLRAHADGGVDGSTSSGSGAGVSPGAAAGGICPYPPPKPEYPICYVTRTPPCLTSADKSLGDRLPALSGKAARGPFVSADPDTCAMLCCYGE